MSFYVCTNGHFSAGGGPDLRCKKITTEDPATGRYDRCEAERTEMEFEEWYSHVEKIA